MVASDKNVNRLEYSSLEKWSVEAAAMGYGSKFQECWGKKKVVECIRIYTMK